MKTLKKIIIKKKLHNMDRIQQFFFIWLELHLQQYITQISYTKEQTGSMLKQEEAENWALIGPPSGGGEEKKKK